MTTRGNAEYPCASDVVSRNVRLLRKARGLSVRALAARCASLGASQLTEASLSNIERGRNRNRRRRDITVDDLTGLAAALDVKPCDLLSELTITVTATPTER